MFKNTMELNTNFKQIKEFRYLHNSSNSSLLYIISKFVNKFQQLFNYLKYLELYRFCKESLKLQIFDLSGYKGDDSSTENENIFDNLNTICLKELRITNSTLTSKDCKKLIEALKKVRDKLSGSINIFFQTKNVCKLVIATSLITPSSTLLNINNKKKF